LLHVRPLGFTDFIASAGTAQWGQVSRSPFPNKEYLPQFFFEIAKNISDLMLYRYSRGDDINLIGRRFDTLLDSWEKSVGLGNDIWDEDTKRTRTSWDVNIDFYSYCLRLVGLSLLLVAPEKPPSSTKCHRRQRHGAKGWPS
ncbi:PoNe immunity protein domain-containing protein, partial [Xanthomonas campestris pv. campestris]|nr:PoNe immunity protein domain-containing protein [Xanthomonas campestris pv. campestris]